MRRKPAAFQFRFVDDGSSEGENDNGEDDDDEDEDRYVLFDRNGEKIPYAAKDESQHPEADEVADEQHLFLSSSASHTSASSDKKSLRSNMSVPAKRPKRRPYVRSKTLEEEETSRLAASHAARVLQRRRRVIGIRRAATTRARRKTTRRTAGRRQYRRSRTAAYDKDPTYHPRRRNSTMAAKPSKYNIVQARASRIFATIPNITTTNVSGSSTPTALVMQPSLSAVHMSTANMPSSTSTTGAQSQHYLPLSIDVLSSPSLHQQQQSPASSIVCFATQPPLQQHTPRRSRKPSGHLYNDRRLSAVRTQPSDTTELIELTLTDLERISAALSTTHLNRHQSGEQPHSGSESSITLNPSASAASRQLASLVECTTRDDVVKCYSEYRQRCDEAMSQIAGNCLAYVCVVLELRSDSGGDSSPASRVNDALERRCNAEKIAIFSQTMRKILLDLRRNVDSQHKNFRSGSPSPTRQLGETETTIVSATGSPHNVRFRLTQLGTLNRVFHHLLSKADDNRLYDIDLNMDSIEPLLAAAKILRMDFVQALVARFILLTMNEQRCLHFLRLALHYKMRDLAQHSLRRAQLSFGHLVNSNEWLLADPSVVLELVRSRQLNCAREQQVYDAVMLWVRRELDSRKVHVNSIMLHIRFQELNKFALWKAWAELRTLVGAGTCAQLEDYIIACAQYADLEMRHCLGPAVQQMVKEPRVFSANGTAGHQHHAAPHVSMLGARPMTHNSGTRHQANQYKVVPGGLERYPANSTMTTAPIIKRAHCFTGPTAMHQQRQTHRRPVTVAVGDGVAVRTRTLGLISQQISRPSSPLSQNDRAQFNSSPSIMDMPSPAGGGAVADGFGSLTPTETQSR